MELCVRRRSKRERETSSDLAVSIGNAPGIAGFLGAFEVRMTGARVGSEVGVFLELLRGEDAPARLRDAGCFDDHSIGTGEICGLFRVFQCRFRRLQGRSSRLAGVRSIVETNFRIGDVNLLVVRTDIIVELMAVVAEQSSIVEFRFGRRALPSSRLLALVPGKHDVFFVEREKNERSKTSCCFWRRLGDDRCEDCLIREERESQTTSIDGQYVLLIESRLRDEACVRANPSIQ